MGSLAQQPVSLSGYDFNLGDAELGAILQQIQDGQFARLREYLARTRADADWQDRIFVLEQLTPYIPLRALDEACSAEPDAVDLQVIRCAFYGGLAGKSRGTGTANQVSRERFQNSAECVKAAMNAMARSTHLDDKDPTAHTLVIRPLTIFGETEMQQKAFARATAIAPDLVPAHFGLISALSKRWGGSHETCLAFARQALSKAAQGSDMAACLFWAHSLVRTHLLHFDKDPQAAKQYAAKPDVIAELNAALDNWLAPSYTPRRSSIQYLKKATEWYAAAVDIDRLQRVAAFTGEEFKVKKSGGLLGWLFGGK